MATLSSSPSDETRLHRLSVLWLVALLLLGIGVLLIVAAIIGRTGSTQTPNIQPIGTPSTTGLGPIPGRYMASLRLNHASARPSGTVIHGSTVAYAVPNDWKIVDKWSCGITTSDPKGVMHISAAACGFSKAETALQLQEGLASNLQGHYPDVKICGKPLNTSLGSPSRKGIMVMYCYTQTSAAGGSFPAYNLTWNGVSSNGRVGYGYTAVGTQSTYQQRAKQWIIPIANTLHWLQ
jgi:hypothetical protein